MCLISGPQQLIPCIWTAFISEILWESEVSWLEVSSLLLLYWIGHSLLNCVLREQLFLLNDSHSALLLLNSCGTQRSLTMKNDCLR